MHGVNIPCDMVHGHAPYPALLTSRRQQCQIVDGHVEHFIAVEVLLEDGRVLFVDVGDDVGEASSELQLVSKLANNHTTTRAIHRKSIAYPFLDSNTNVIPCP